MKKGLLITLLVIVVAGGSFLMTYLIMDKRNTLEKTPTNEPTEVKEQIKRVETVKNGEKIVQKYEVQMNGKTVPVNVEYRKETINLEDRKDWNAELIYGSIAGKEIFSDYEEIYAPDASISEIFVPATINKGYGIDNFQIIKGKDNKDYLLVFSQFNDYYAGGFQIVYIFNDEMEALDTSNTNSPYQPGSDKNSLFVYSQNGLLPERNIWYENTYGYKGSRFLLKVENNEIHYLMSLPNISAIEGNSDNYGTIEERVYTINNNKLEYTVSNTYKAIGISGQIS